MDSDGAQIPVKPSINVKRSIKLLGLALLICATALAQGRGGGAGRGGGGGGRGGGGRGGGAANARTGGGFDPTGYWVSVVTEDWMFRMVTPPKGQYLGVPISAAGRRIADAWDPAKDEADGNQCKAYGAAGVMRLPGRLHITWENDTTLRIDTDAGTQTRLFHFGAAAPAPAAGAQNIAPSQPAEPSWQGNSVAEWELAAAGARGSPRMGDLKVVTTNLKAGYLRKNGVPYSAGTILTEYYDLHTAEDGDVWLVVTTEVNDPASLTQTFVTSTHFKKQADAAGWDPQPCSAK
jgi:hypothetical protein